MKNILSAALRSTILATLAICPTYFLSAQEASTTKTSIGGIVDLQVSNAERQVLAVANAMPQDKYNFVPSSSGFSGVRSFSAEIKHLIAANCGYWGPASTNGCSTEITDETKFAANITKEQLIADLKESFTVGHNAAQQLTTSNFSEIITQLDGKKSLVLTL